MIITLKSKENKVKGIALELSVIEFMIFHEAIDVYAHERENEIDREVANTMLKTIDEMKGKQE